MGRRKIEIRPIKDDRNRSVTFLKRKGGLFKKAYELGVLCQVDVAVIIFGNNKKLYEFSSGDINDTITRFQYFSGAHEHKGPDDFAGKGGDDDEDEDADGGSPAQDSPPEPRIPSHAPHRSQSIQGRQPTPSVASPPLPNGNMKLEHRASPQPNQLSRPASRTTQAHRPAHLLPPQYAPSVTPVQQPPYGYTPQQQQYYAHPQQPMNMPHSAQHPPPVYQQHNEPMMHPGIPSEHHRRQSLPPHFHQPAMMVPPHQPYPSQHVHPAGAQAHPRRLSPQPPDHYQSPPAPQSQYRSPPGPQPQYQSPPGPHSRNSFPSARSTSIFTPIEESRSLLAQHWGAAPSSDPARHDQSGPRGHAIEFPQFSQVRIHPNSPQMGKSPLGDQLYQPPPAAEVSYYAHAPVRSLSAHSLNSIPPGSRSSTMQSEARRPRLKVQIPSEQSDTSEDTADTSAVETAVTSHPLPPKSVVLPPPSPSSKNPLLSAGATGPPNPFARPGPPLSSSHNNSNSSRELETPLSALPSRVMKGDMLPSPSDLWSNMFSRSGSDNMMPSPLNFQPTPITAQTPSLAAAASSSASAAAAVFRDDEERKRRAEGELANQEKRIRT